MVHFPQIVQCLFPAAFAEKSPLTLRILCVNLRMLREIFHLTFSENG